MATHSSILAWKIPKTEEPVHTSYYYYTVFAGSKLADLVILYNTVKGTDKSQEALYLNRRVET